jgi:hypothetical protein
MQNLRGFPDARHKFHKRVSQTASNTNHVIEEAKQISSLNVTQTQETSFTKMKLFKIINILQT